MFHNELPVWFILPFLFALGATVGSFLNVCVYRIPQHETLWAQLKSVCDGRSYCPKCRRGIRWHDNLPIIGWLKLGGRCRDCRQRISWRYPAVEFLNAALFVLVYWCEVPLGMGVKLEDSCLFSLVGPQNHPGLGEMSPLLFVHLRYAYHLVLVEALLVASLIDLDLRIIPDASTVPAWIAGLLAACALDVVHLVPAPLQNDRLVRDFRPVIPDQLEPWIIGDVNRPLPDDSEAFPNPVSANPVSADPRQAGIPAPRSGGPVGLVPSWVQAHPHWHGLLSSVAGSIVGAGAVWLLRILGHWALGREAMGFGDVILMGMIGAFLGWQPTLIAFFIAPACAMVVVAVTFLFRREQEIPYGPYLSLGALITLLGFRSIWAYCFRVFQLGVLLLPIAIGMAALFFVTLLTMQGVKRLFGWNWTEPSEVAEWLPADQTFYLSGENVDHRFGKWPLQSDWPGESAARGTLQHDQWLRGE